MQAKRARLAMAVVTGGTAWVWLAAGCGIFDQGDRGGGGGGPECTADADCPAEQVCDGGECGPAPPECTTDADCPPGQACQDGQCEPVIPDCTTDADCPAGEVCTFAGCVPPPT